MSSFNEPKSISNPPLMVSTRVQGSHPLTPPEPRSPSLTKAVLTSSNMGERSYGKYRDSLKRMSGTEASPTTADDDEAPASPVVRPRRMQAQLDPNDDGDIRDKLSAYLSRAQVGAPPPSVVTASENQAIAEPSEPTERKFIKPVPTEGTSAYAAVAKEAAASGQERLSSKPERQPLQERSVSVSQEQQLETGLAKSASSGDMSSEHGTLTYKQFRQRQALKCGGILLLAIAFPVAIGLGVALSSPSRTSQNESNLVPMPSSVVPTVPPLPPAAPPSTPTAEIPQSTSVPTPRLITFRPVNSILDIFPNPVP